LSLMLRQNNKLGCLC